MGLRDAGDAVELAKRYVEEGADELVFLDITATVENATLTDLVRKVSKEINIPFTVGRHPLGKRCRGHHTSGSR